MAKSLFQSKSAKQKKNKSGNLKEMKVFGVLIALVVVGVVAMFVVSAPMIKEMSSCIQDSTLKMKASTKLAIERRSSKDEICLGDKLIVEDTRTCLLAAQKQTGVPLVLVESATKLFNPKTTTLSEIITSHNRVCTKEPVLPL